MYTEERMKTMLPITLSLIGLAVFVACSPKITFKAGIKTDDIDVNASLSPMGRLLDFAQGTVKIDNEIKVEKYFVTFYEIQIGNSEQDKMTLWENANGEKMDITEPITYYKDKDLRMGDFEFCRIVIGKTIKLKGSYNNGPTETVEVEVSGNANNSLSDEEKKKKQAFLFGTSSAVTGKYHLRDEIRISEETTLLCKFNIDGTVSYNNGFLLEPPVLEFDSK